MIAAADAKWADAAHSVPASLYSLSGEVPADARWICSIPARHMLRLAPSAPTTTNPAYVDEMVEVLGRTGFHAPLNYYRANHFPSMKRSIDALAETVPVLLGVCLPLTLLAPD